MAAMPVSLSTVTDVEPHGSGDRLAGEQIEIAFEHGTDTNVLASANPPNDGRWVSGHNTVERRADALHDGAESHGNPRLSRRLPVSHTICASSIRSHCVPVQQSLSSGPRAMSSLKFSTIVVLILITSSGEHFVSAVLVFLVSIILLFPII